LTFLFCPILNRASSSTLCPSAKNADRHMPLFATRALSLQSCSRSWDAGQYPEGEEMCFAMLVVAYSHRQLDGSWASGLAGDADLVVIAHHNNALSRSVVLDSARGGLVLTRSRTRPTVCLVRRVLLPWTPSGFHRQQRQERHCSSLVSRPPISNSGAMGEMPVSGLTVAVCRRLIAGSRGWGALSGESPQCGADRG
jgi:hypothetical protein